MRRIKTGQGVIALSTLMAIWSVSLVINLPGLAISPLLGRLNAIFTHTSQLEVQLLTVLPNLFIIPFVVLSGHLAVSRNKLVLLRYSLLLYLLCGVLYLFATAMWQLIVLSCLLGVACGIVIPLAAGLVTDYFVGAHRMTQLGIKSGVANMSLVVATFVVGALADGADWHLPFAVYLMPLIPLFLIRYLAKEPIPLPALSAGEGTPGRIDWKSLVPLMIIYAFFTYLAVLVAYYTPYLTASCGVSDTELGAITSLFFIAIMLPGFFLSLIIRYLQRYTILVAVASMTLGVWLMFVSSHTWMFAVAAFLMGAGYGIYQPILYDKAADTASAARTTFALSLLLMMNYVAVTVSPFVVNLFEVVFHSDTPRFPFLLDGVFCSIFLVWVLFRLSHSPYAIKREYYAAKS